MGAGRRRSRPAAVAAAGTVLVLVALTGCGAGSSSSAPPASSPTAGASSRTASSSVSDSPSPSGSTQSPTGSATAGTDDGFSSDPASGGTPYTGPAQAHLQRIAVGSHTGYDRLVLYFGSDAVPPYTVTPQDSASFKADPSDQAVTLKGTSGVRVVLQNTARANQTVEDLRPMYPAIRQVRNIGDFEAVVSYAVGVLGRAQVRVTTMTAPNRLVIDVAWPDPA